MGNSSAQILQSSVPLTMQATGNWRQRCWWTPIQRCWWAMVVLRRKAKWRLRPGATRKSIRIWQCNINNISVHTKVGLTIPRGIACLRLEKSESSSAGKKHTTRGTTSVLHRSPTCPRGALPAVSVAWSTRTNVFMLWQIGYSASSISWIDAHKTSSTALHCIMASAGIISSDCAMAYLGSVGQLLIIVGHIAIELCCQLLAWKRMTFAA